MAFHKLIEAFTTAGVLCHFDYHKPTRLESPMPATLPLQACSSKKRGALASRSLLLPQDDVCGEELRDPRQGAAGHRGLPPSVEAYARWPIRLSSPSSRITRRSSYFKSQRRISGRQARWAVLLADFDFVVQYRPGNKAGEPDALTRRRDMEPSAEEQNHNLRQLLHPRMFEVESLEESEQERVSADKTPMSELRPRCLRPAPW